MYALQDAGRENSMPEYFSHKRDLVAHMNTCGGPIPSQIIGSPSPVLSVLIGSRSPESQPVDFHMNFLKLEKETPLDISP